MTPHRPYVGRFAPSPTGRLHLGSMVAAVASWLDAKVHGGKWLVRMDDLDPPREVAGAADDILRTLEGFGLAWDGPVVYQSKRHEMYRAALDDLVQSGFAFGCACTRKVLAEASGLEVYPGFCRDGLPAGVSPRSWRFKMPAAPALAWDDRMQGMQSMEREAVGDVTVLRADGHWAYHLAVVVDDAAQGITDVVRGADLLSSTGAHVALQQALKFVTPRYAHVPVMHNNQGQKLSKQTKAAPVEVKNASQVLLTVFEHLHLDGTAQEGLDPPEVMLNKALSEWSQKWRKEEGA